MGAAPRSVRTALQRQPGLFEAAFERRWPKLCAAPVPKDVPSATEAASCATGPPKTMSIRADNRRDSEATQMAPTDKRRPLHSNMLGSRRAGLQTAEAERLALAYWEGTA